MVIILFLIHNSWYLGIEALAAVTLHPGPCPYTYSILPSPVTTDEGTPDLSNKNTWNISI
jgi:hypothetical protein